MSSGICLKNAPRQSWRVSLIQRQNCVIFSVRLERRKLDKKKQTYTKSENANSIVESFKYFSQKSILIISSNTFSKLVRLFLRH